MTEARVYTIYHGKTDLPHPIKTDYVPLNADRRDGENISDKLSYSEMRGHYWVWKNEDMSQISHVGFQHYRRWLWLWEPNGKELYHNNPGEFKRYTDWAVLIPRWVCDFDFVVPKSWSFAKPIGVEYSQSHSGEHWEILLDECQDFKPLAVNEHSYNVCSIFIARVEYFRLYMSFWWDLCQRIVKRITIPFSGYQSRAMAFLSERIFSLWLKRERQISGLRVFEVPLIVDLIYKVSDSWELG